MKRTSILAALAWLTLSVGDSRAQEYRTFTTADESKSIVAAVTNVFPDKGGKRFIEIEREDNGRRYKVLAETFSEEDRAHIEEVAQLINLGRNLDVRIAPKEDRSSPKLAGGRSVITASHKFDVEFRNNSKVDMSGLEIEYRIFFSQDNRKGELDRKREHGYKDGTLKLAALSSRTQQSLSSRPVSITHDKPNRGGPG